MTVVEQATAQELAPRAATAAARAFHLAAVAALLSQGEPASVGRVCQILNVPETQYTSIVVGRPNYGTLETVVRWLAAWSEAGYPELHLQVGPGFAQVGYERVSW
jgi:hypothetical protein